MTVPCEKFEKCWFQARSCIGTHRMPFQNFFSGLCKLEWHWSILFNSNRCCYRIATKYVFTLFFYSTFPCTPTHHIPLVILKAFHILSSDMKTRDQVWIMCLSYLLRQSANRASLMPQHWKTRSNAELEGKLLLQGEIKPRSQLFPFTFTIIN